MKLSIEHNGGYITAEQYQRRLGELLSQEWTARMQVDQSQGLGRLGLAPLSIAICLVIGFRVGFFVSPELYPRLFGYKTAEECVIQHGSTAQAMACYTLYPRAQQYGQ